MGGLTTSETGDFTQGTLVIETSDGERLTLEADSGQPGSVLITLDRGRRDDLGLPFLAGGVAATVMLRGDHDVSRQVSKGMTDARGLSCLTRG